MINKDCSSSLIFGIVCQLDRDQYCNNPQLISMKTLQVSKRNGKTVTCVGVKNILVLFDSKLLTLGTAN